VAQYQYICISKDIQQNRFPAIHTQGFFVESSIYLAKKVADAAINDGVYLSISYSRSDKSAT